MVQMERSMLVLQLYRSQLKFVYQITGFCLSPMCGYLSGRIVFSHSLFDISSANLNNSNSSITLQTRGRHS